MWVRRWWGVRVHRPSGERGSFAFAVVFWALIVMLLAGFVVDGGLAITERQRAGDIAEQAARAGAQQLNVADLRNGTLTIDEGAACAQAKAVAVASGVAGSAVTCGPFGSTTTSTNQVVPTITVRVTITYTPILLGLFYSPNFTANASATAYPQAGT